MINQRFPALKYRNFRIFWIGQFVSLIGTWMQSTVLPYLAYRLTDQPIYLGAIGFATSLPTLLLTLPGGVLVERYDKRKMVIIFQSILMIQAFTLAYLAITAQITIWHILALALVQGSAYALEISARQVMLIELVGREALPNAIALNSTIFNAARVLGPAFAAPFLVLLKDAGEGWAFFANGISFLFVIVGLLMIRTSPQVREARRPVGLQDFAEGQKYIRQTPLVASLILLAAIPGFWGFTFVQQIPVFARDVLHVAGDTADIVATRNSLMITFQGIGALVAAVSLASFSGFRRKAFILMIGQFVFALALIAISQTQWIPLAMLLMAVIGWGMVTQLTLTNTLIQLLVPDHLRGRVISTYLWALQGVAPFGSLVIGWLAQNFGAPVAVLTGGSVCLLGYLIVHLRRPFIRHLLM